MKRKILSIILLVFLTSFILTSPNKVYAKSPVISFFLSLVLPGAGQYYNGHIFKGLAFQAACYFGFQQSLSGAFGRDSTQASLGGLIFFGSWIGSCIDAPISSNKINKNKPFNSNKSLILSELDLVYNRNYFEPNNNETYRN